MLQFLSASQLTRPRHPFGPLGSGGKSWRRDTAASRVRAAPPFGRCAEGVALFFNLGRDDLVALGHAFGMPQREVAIMEGDDANGASVAAGVRIDK